MLIFIPLDNYTLLSLMTSGFKSYCSEIEIVHFFGKNLQDLFILEHGNKTLNTTSIKTIFYDRQHENISATTSTLHYTTIAFVLLLSSKVP